MRSSREAAAPNLIKELQPSAPDQVWASDITYVATLEGWLYLAVILDLFSRRVVGWKLTQTLESELVVAALRNALVYAPAARGPVLSLRSRQPVQQPSGA
jgi:putative transposase